MWKIGTRKKNKMVTIYSKNNCQKCRLTKRQMQREGIAYNEINVEENPDVADRLRSAGFREMPIVRTDEAGTWSGYRADRIRALVDEAKANNVTVIA